MVVEAIPTSLTVQVVSAPGGLQQRARAGGPVRQTAGELDGVMTSSFDSSAGI